jgi:hypothetical protein
MEIITIQLNTLQMMIIFELYRNITCKTPDLDKIRTLYKELESNRVRGWIMIRALSMIK